MADTYESIFPERHVRYASFFDRFVAALIDGVLLWLIDLPLAWIIDDNIWGDSWYVNAISLTINLLYFALQESGPKQATLGKQAMRIHVTNLEGGRISLAQGVGRYFARWVSALILFIGYFMMLWDNRKQTLHDKLANTLVVYGQ
jgi:uncharacterized RDD family membrane protein YckC